MNRIIWAMPNAVHNFILRVTGYRLAKITTDDDIFLRFMWTKKWPINESK